MNPPSSTATASRTGYTRAWGRLATAVRRIGGLVTGLPAAPGVQMASWSLSAGPSSVPRARRLTRARLAAWELEGFSDVVELLVSELVTNALRHAPGPCRLRLSALDGLFRCEVEDTGADLPGMLDERAWDEGGRGLHLVNMLSCCWGGCRTPTGKTMWFELPTFAGLSAPDEVPLKAPYAVTAQRRVAGVGCAPARRPAPGQGSDSGPRPEA